MPFFSSTVEAALQGRKVNFAYLQEFQFTTSPAYFWNGVGPLNIAGKTWLGAAQLGSIDGLQEALNGESFQRKLSISGAKLTSRVAQAAASDDRATYVGQLERTWIQFFDADWQPLDPPYAGGAGLMDGVQISRGLPAKDGSVVRELAVTSENIFYNRRVPANGYYTDSDQKQRYPGDRGCEFIPSLQDKTIAVPW